MSDAKAQYEIGDIVQCTNCKHKWPISAMRDLYTCSKCGEGGFCYGCLMSHWHSEHELGEEAPDAH